MTETLAPAPARSPAGPRRAVLGVGLLALTGAVIFWGYGAWSRAAPWATTDNAYVKGDVTFVTSKVSGYVAAVEAENNERVAPGAVLIRIDERDLAAAVAEARAAVARQRAAQAQAEAEAGLREADNAVSRSAVDAARARQARTRADLDRARRLLASRIVSQAYHDQALSEDLQAQAAIAQAEAQLELSLRRAAIDVADRQAAAADLAAALARLDKAESDLQSAQVTAPREGVAIGRSVRIGEYVNAGQRLVAIAPTRGLWIEANLRETQIARLRPGDRAAVRIDALPGRVFCGRVAGEPGASGADLALLPADTANGAFTKIVRRFPLRIALDPAQADLDRLAPGMSARPTVAYRSAAGDAPFGFPCR